MLLFITDKIRTNKYWFINMYLKLCIECECLFINIFPVYKQVYIMLYKCYKTTRKLKMIQLEIEICNALWFWSVNVVCTCNILKCHYFIIITQFVIKICAFSTEKSALKCNGKLRSNLLDMYKGAII